MLCPVGTLAYNLFQNESDVACKFKPPTIEWAILDVAVYLGVHLNQNGAWGEGYILLPQMSDRDQPLVAFP